MSAVQATPGAPALLNNLKSTLQLKSDAALASKFPVVSKIRHGVMTVGDRFLIKSREIGGLSFAELLTFVPAVP